ncbi:MAG: N-acyl homoserine lactonase family protein [Deltaproteobacteria bacterium]|nr:N-acyl homoserine lactonase family protein [Deltaproteobacteria bacterium]MBW2022110.1 N-acyl homoserine lactonase family protein [Deltaproteobacteria bacterium]MBW2045228.1 N-acyl homoserine lactonase family protein [Deltaproteobacteria bacterium]MBW2300208.1 N-acyl homoserine lactonase family protein [Deltaproteobacteria bacterium]
MSHMKVRPLHVGSVKRNKTTFLMGAQPEPIDLPIVMFLIQTEDVNVLVDTGTRDPKETPPLHNPYEQSEAQRVENVLGKLGLHPNDINIVINTHLHWDHCSNNRLFEKAMFYVQREELRYASAPLRAHAHGYEAFELGLVPPFASTRFEVVEGDHKIIEGVWVLFTPGHTPGSQAVLVDSGEKSCILAGDNIPLYENLKERDIRAFKPSTLYVDLEEYYRSIRRLLEFDVPLIPGHEIGVMRQKDLLD